MGCWQLTVIHLKKDSLYTSIDNIFWTFGGIAKIKYDPIMHRLNLGWAQSMNNFVNIVYLVMILSVIG